MAKYTLYDIEDDSFHNYYEADAKKTFGGPWGDESQHLNMQIPDGIDYRKHYIIEVIIPDGQTEDDIVFDHKAEYMKDFVPVVKYYKFEYDEGKAGSIDQQDAEAQRIAEKNERKIEGSGIKNLCDDLLSIVASHVRRNNLTPQQITDLKTTHADIFTLLKDCSPLSARTLIENITIDGTLITQDMHTDLMLEYNDFDANYPDI